MGMHSSPQLTLNDITNAAGACSPTRATGYPGVQNQGRSPQPEVMHARGIVREGVR